MPAALLAIAAFLLTGCASTPAVPAEPASISGIITQVSRSPDQITVLIEERPDQTSGDDKSSVRITPRTQVLLDGPEGVTELDRDRLAAGARASAWFTGPVAESYPTQATARVLVVHPR